MVRAYPQHNRTELGCADIKAHRKGEIGSMTLDRMPHANQPVYTAGIELDGASAAMVLLHGRGATAEDILSLSAELEYPGLAFLAPQAEGYAWYPNRFLAPLAQNEPYLSSALALIDGIIKQIEAHGI